MNVRPGPTQRERAIAFCRELNQVALDLRIATRVLAHFDRYDESQFKEPDDVAGIVKMCVGHQVLALARFDQLVDPHWDLIPDGQRGVCAAIRGEIARREVHRFRGSIVAHPFDGRGGPLLLPSEANRRFAEGLGKGDAGSWHRWISPWDGNEDQTPGVTQHLNVLRDAIARHHGINERELLEALRQ